MEDFVEIRMWGELRLDFLRRFYAFERGLPSHDTLNDVVNALDARLFQACFSRWVESLRDDIPDIIAIDGKTVTYVPYGQKDAIDYYASLRSLYRQNRAAELRGDATPVAPQPEGLYDDPGAGTPEKAEPGPGR